MLVKSYYPGSNATSLFYPVSQTALAAGTGAPGGGVTTATQSPMGFPGIASMGAFSAQQAAAAAAAAAALQHQPQSFSNHLAFSQQLALQQQLAQQQQHAQVVTSQPLITVPTSQQQNYHAPNKQRRSSSSSDSQKHNTSAMVTTTANSNSTGSNNTNPSSTPSSAKKFRPAYTRPAGKSQRYIPKPIPQELGNLKVYSNPDILICGNCREMFSDLVDMIEHKKLYCKLRFTCKCDITNEDSACPIVNGTCHKSAEDSSKRRYLHCVTCKSPFASAWDLMVHVQTAHMLNIYLLADGNKIQKNKGDESTGPSTSTKASFSSSPTGSSTSVTATPNSTDKAEENKSEGISTKE